MFDFIYLGYDFEHVKGEEDDEADRKKENAKSSGSTKRSRAAAIHNQSERVRNFLFF